MRKKNYIKPEVLVVPTEASVILAGSTYNIQKATEADYTDEKVSNFWDKDSRSIWAD
mgnify:CR=1 FL=1